MGPYKFMRTNPCSFGCLTIVSALRKARKQKQWIKD